MLRRIWLITGFLAALALAPTWARAVELKTHEVTDDEKVIHYTFKLSAEAEPTEEFFFDGNFYSLHIPGLVLSRQQRRISEVKAPQHLREFYKSIRFVQGEGEAELRIYLSKLCSPADPQLMSYDQGVIKVDLIKPLFKLENDEPETPTPAGETPGNSQVNSSGAEPGFIPDNQATPAGPAPAGEAEITQANNHDEPVEAPGGTLRTGNPVSPAGNSAASGSQAAPEDTPPVEDTPETDTPPEATGAAPEYGATTSGEIIGGATQSAPTKYSRQDSPAQPEDQPGQAPATGSFSSGPSYKQFDLSTVPANSVSISALPLRQAIIELVAGCGFNVIVDDDVDNSELYLNFTQKELSLKSALDLLCIAYDLSYVVEDDAIVILAK